MGDMSSSPAREAFHRAFYTDGTVDAEDIGGGWAKDVLGAWGADVPLVGLRNDVKGASQGAMTRGTTNGAALMLKGILGGRGGPTLNLRAETESEARATKELKVAKKRERERLRSSRRRKQQTDEQRERERLRSKKTPDEDDRRPKASRSRQQDSKKGEFKTKERDSRRCRRFGERFGYGKVNFSSLAVSPSCARPHADAEVRVR